MRVFISYRHRDKFAALLIHRWLASDGIQVIRDESDFEPNQLNEEITKNIKSCDVFLVVLGPPCSPSAKPGDSSYYESESKWPPDELGQARAFKKPILFVAIGENLLPGETDRQQLVLDLIRKDVRDWRSLVIEAVRAKVKKRGKRSHKFDPKSLNQWLSHLVGVNNWVKEQIAHENLDLGVLRLASCVELASRLNGWSHNLGNQEKDIRINLSGLFEVEKEVLNRLPQGKSLGSYTTNDNYALASYKVELSDEPYLDLTLSRVDHLLVREVADKFDEIKNSIFPQRCLFDTPISYPHSVVVHMVLITGDRPDPYMIVGHRSSRPRFYDNTWAITYEEHMRVSSDRENPFYTAIRGFKEELIGEDAWGVTEESVRFFSLFRELDRWKSKREKAADVFWDINIGLAGIVEVPYTYEEIFYNWRETPIDKREFRYVAALPYDFPTIFKLLTANTLRPRELVELHARFPEEIDPNFPSFEDSWRWWHPTTKIRLARCLTYQFLDALKDKVTRQK
jgi:hypothetical protein